MAARTANSGGADNTPAEPQDAPQGAENTNTPSTSTSGGQPASLPADKAKKAVESEYSAVDLAAAARQRFGVPPEVVSAALKQAGKKKTTFADAQRIVKAFMERRVKR